MASNSDKSGQLRRGVVVGAGLAVLSGVEYWVAVGGLTGTLPLLTIAAVGKAALIAEYFMHMHSVMRAEGDHQ